MKKVKKVLDVGHRGVLMEATRSLSIAGIVAAAILVVILGRQNASLRSTVEAQSPVPQLGMWIPPYNLTCTDGHKLQVGESSPSMQVLYFFHPKCPHCSASESALSFIATTLQKNRSIDLVAVSAAPSSELDAYIRASAPPYCAAHLDTKKLFSLFRVEGVPALIVIGRDGIIRYTHSGEIVGKGGALKSLQGIEEALADSS